MAECKDCIHFCVCSPYTSPNESYPEVGGCKCFKATTDVVPKSEVVEMQKEQLGRLKEIKSEVERVTVEYEAMRGAANSYKMHYEQAKTEVERLQAEVDQLHALLECGVFANSVEDWQKFLNEKRAEVAREIFAEIEKIRAKEIHKCEILRVQENEASERKYWEGGEHSLRQLSYWIAELKKKYTEENT